jgi:hypothetical protein
MDSGSDDVKTTFDGEKGGMRGNALGSDSAHSSTHSPSSTTVSDSATSSSDTSLLYEIGREEEAVSLAYIDESKTVHKYIASRLDFKCIKFTVFRQNYKTFIPLVSFILSLLQK